MPFACLTDQSATQQSLFVQRLLPCKCVKSVMATTGIASAQQCTMLAWLNSVLQYTANSKSLIRLCNSQYNYNCQDCEQACAVQASGARFSSQQHHLLNRCQVKVHSSCRKLQRSVALFAIPVLAPFRPCQLFSSETTNGAFIYLAYAT